MARIESSIIISSSIKVGSWRDNQNRFQGVNHGTAQSFNNEDSGTQDYHEAQFTTGGRVTYYTNDPNNGTGNQRSFKEVLMHREQQNIRESQEEQKIKSSNREQPIGNDRNHLRIVNGSLNEANIPWLQRSVIVETGEPSSLSDFSKLADNRWRAVERVRGMGSSKFIITFKTVNDMEYALNQENREAENNNMQDRNWSAKEEVSQRSVWLEILGIPPEAWCRKNMELVVQTIGKVVGIDSVTEDGESMESARVLVNTCFMPFIEDHLILKVGELNYKVFIRELQVSSKLPPSSAPEEHGSGKQSDDHVAEIGEAAEATRLNGEDDDVSRAGSMGNDMDTRVKGITNDVVSHLPSREFEIETGHDNSSDIQTPTVNHPPTKHLSKMFDLNTKWASLAHLNLTRRELQPSSKTDSDSNSSEVAVSVAEECIAACDFFLALATHNTVPPLLSVGGLPGCETRASNNYAIFRSFSDTHLVFVEMPLSTRTLALISEEHLWRSLKHLEGKSNVDSELKETSEVDVPSKEAYGVETNNDALAFDSSVSTKRTLCAEVLSLASTDPLEQKGSTLMPLSQRLTRTACPTSVFLLGWILQSKETRDFTCPIEGIFESPFVSGYSVSNSLEGNVTVGLMLGKLREGVTAVESLSCPSVSTIVCKYAAILQVFLQHAYLPVWYFQNSEFSHQLPDRAGRSHMIVVAFKSFGGFVAVILIVPVSTTSFGDTHSVVVGFKRLVEEFVDTPLRSFSISQAVADREKVKSNHDVDVRIHAYTNIFWFSIAPTIIFQFPTLVAETLYSLASDWACFGLAILLFDICGGTGTIGLTFKHRIGMVIGIKLHAYAVSDAVTNVVHKTYLPVVSVSSEMNLLGSDQKNREGSLGASEAELNAHLQAWSANPSWVDKSRKIKIQHQTTTRSELQGLLDACAASVTESINPLEALLGLHSVDPVHFDAFHIVVLVDTSIHMSLLRAFYNSFLQKLTNDSRGLDAICAAECVGPNKVKLFKALMVAPDISTSIAQDINMPYVPCALDVTTWFSYSPPAKYVNCNDGEILLWDAFTLHTSKGYHANHSDTVNYNSLMLVATEGHSSYFSRAKGSLNFKQWDPGGCSFVHWNVQLTLRSLGKMPLHMLKIFPIPTLRTRLLWTTRVMIRV